MLKRMCVFVMMLLSVIGVLAQAAAPVGKTIWLYCVETDSFVTVDASDDCRLEARDISTVDANEKFIVEDAGSGNIRFKAVANDNYVQADAANSNKLHANTSAMTDARTHFEWFDLGEGKIRLKNVGNGKYVKHGGAQNVLRATTASTGPETEFLWGDPDVDAFPPLPNPAVFSHAPYAISGDTIRMIARSGYDQSGPVEYYFAETSGNPGGSDSGWQFSASYTDSGLEPNTQYSYTVQMRDRLGHSGAPSHPPDKATTDIMSIRNTDVDGSGFIDINDLSILASEWLDSGCVNNANMDAECGIGVGDVSVFSSDWLSARPPNIVFIFADDLGYGDLACYGHPYAQTPELDTLASEGTMFRRFYVAGAVCNPSRTGLMTSRYPASFQNPTDTYGFQDRITITELLHQTGYRTGHFGKWHIGPDESNGTYGIDEIGRGGAFDAADPPRRDWKIFQGAMKFIEDNKDHPFYVNVWGYITHYKVDPPEDLPELEAFENLVVNRDDFNGQQIQDQFDDCEMIGGDISRGMRRYMTEVLLLDTHVGALLHKIDELGLRHNTIVVFSSDHGPAPVITGGKNLDPNLPDSEVPSRNMLGYSGGLRGQKHRGYEGSVRSPFIVRWPGRVPAGKVNETSIFSALDWLPTLCSIADVPINPEQFQGEDVSDIWLGADRSRLAPLFWKSAMLDGNWKLYDKNMPELYHLAVDPAETINVAGAHPDVVHSMQQQISDWAETLSTE